VKVFTLQGNGQFSTVLGVEDVYGVLCQFWRYASFDEFG
jgi:hypothetical protein